MPTFSWDPTGGYYYPDQSGQYNFTGPAEADAANAPGYDPTSSTNPVNQGNALTQAFFQQAGVGTTDTNPFDVAEQSQYNSTFSTAAAATQQANQSQSSQNQQNQQSQGAALGVLENELTSWGFGADAIAWASQEIQSNKSVDQILFDLRQQPFYVNSIFGQTNAARTKAGLPVMNEADILNYKDTAMQIARSAGLPQGFMTDQELTNLMGSDVSASELSQRVTQEYVNATQALPVVRNELARMYGLSPDQITPGGLAAYYLDPTKALPALHQQLTSAQIGASAINAGFGQIDRSYAEGLAAQGVTPDAAATGFSNVAREAPLYGQMPGQAAPTLTSAQALGAEFQKNAGDITAVNQASDEAKAAFAGGGKFAQTQGGVGGVGRATSV